MRKTLNRLLGETTLPFTVYHTCPIHGKQFTGNKCPLCYEMGWKKKRIDPSATCPRCGEKVGNCKNKGRAKESE